MLFVAAAAGCGLLNKFNHSEDMNASGLEAAVKD